MTDASEKVWKTFCKVWNGFFLEKYFFLTLLSVHALEHEGLCSFWVIYYIPCNDGYSHNSYKELHFCWIVLSPWCPLYLLAVDSKVLLCWKETWERGNGAQKSRGRRAASLKNKLLATCQGPFILTDKNHGWRKGQVQNISKVIPFSHPQHCWCHSVLCSGLSWSDYTSTGVFAIELSITKKPSFKSASFLLLAWSWAVLKILSSPWPKWKLRSLGTFNLLWLSSWHPAVVQTLPGLLSNLKFLDTCYRLFL